MNDSYQQILYNLALKAYKNGDIPVSALLVKDGTIIAKSYNNRHNKNKLLGHAEINCILEGTKVLDSWRLDDCDLYVTLEPCNMCKEVIKEAKIRNVYYLCSKSKLVNYKTIFNHIPYNSDFFSDLLSKFFDDLR